MKLKIEKKGSPFTIPLFAIPVELMTTNKEPVAFGSYFIPHTDVC